MAGFGNNVETSLLALALVGTAYPYGAGTRVSLHASDPGDTGVGEVVNSGGSAYARQIGAWTVVSGVATLNANLTFTNMPTGTVTHFGVWDATGNFILSGPCVPRVLVLGDQYVLLAGSLVYLD